MVIFITQGVLVTVGTLQPLLFAKFSFQWPNNSSLHSNGKFMKYSFLAKSRFIAIFFSIGMCRLMFDFKDFGLEGFLNTVFHIADTSSNKYLVAL